MTDSEDEELDLQEVILYPNPASDYLKVDLKGFEGQDLKISIYDVLGKSFQQLEMKGSGTIQMPVFSLPAGAYFLSVNNGTDEVRKRFTVQR